MLPVLQQGVGTVRSSVALAAVSQIEAASLQAGVSTASLGKFDRRLAGEKKGERRVLGKRRKLMPVVDSTERSRVSSLVDKIMRERSDDIVDVGRAMGKLEAAAREERHQQKRREHMATGDEDASGRGQRGRGDKGRGGKLRSRGKPAIAAGRGSSGGGRGRGSTRGRGAKGRGGKR